MINHDAIKQAATTGQALSHLTAGQVWAAHKLDMPPERLQAPLTRHTTLLLAITEQEARDAFFGGVVPNDTDAMIARAYDEQHPPFLRLPILETLREGMATFFPDLKTAGYNDNGDAVYALADLAHALGVSEAELMQQAEQRGLTDRIQRTPAPHRIH